MRVMLVSGLACGLFFSSPSAFAQTESAVQEQSVIDPQAIEIARKSADYLASLPALEAGWFITYDEVRNGRQKLTYSWNGVSALDRDRGYRANSQRGDSTREYVHDGKNFTIASLDQGFYSDITLSGSFDRLVSELQSKHGITLPVWEVFSAEHGADYLEEAVEATYHGIVLIGGTAVHHLSFRSADEDRQIWIDTDDERPVALDGCRNRPLSAGLAAISCILLQLGYFANICPGFFLVQPERLSATCDFARVKPMRRLMVRLKLQNRSGA